MTVDQLTRTIGAMIAPGVMITSCLIFFNGLISRYEAISFRLRTMHRERLDMMDAATRMLDDGEAASIKGRHLRRIEQMEQQLPGLLGRHRGVRDAVTALSVALIFLVLSMFLIAGALIVRLQALNFPALGAFLLGTAAFLVSAVINFWELRRSQHEVSCEVEDGLRME
jgi:Protein of unknown function (DUF2721)